jgi:hypothetical protein
MIKEFPVLVEASNRNKSGTKVATSSFDSAEGAKLPILVKKPGSARMQQHEWHALAGVYKISLPTAGDRVRIGMSGLAQSIES